MECRVVLMARLVLSAGVGTDHVARFCLILDTTNTYLPRDTSITTLLGHHLDSLRCYWWLWHFMQRISGKVQFVSKYPVFNRFEGTKPLK